MTEELRADTEAPVTPPAEDRTAERNARARTREYIRWVRGTLESKKPKRA